MTPTPPRAESDAERLLPENSEERRMFDGSLWVYDDPHPLVAVAAALTVWHRMAPKGGSYREVLAIYANECNRARRLLSEAEGEIKRLREELADLQRTFDLQWKADQRAIKQWQAAHPGNDMVWPDRCNMVVWLLDELDRLRVPSADAQNGARPLPFDRDTLGRMVREAWVRWAETQPSPKPSWLVPYDDLDEADKEADRQIGEAIARWVLIGDAARADAPSADADGDQTMSERDAWKEAVIAWSVCASIHREYAKGRDPLYTTRQADFLKHESDSRAALDVAAARLRNPSEAMVKAVHRELYPPERTETKP